MLKNIDTASGSVILAVTVCPLHHFDQLCRIDALRDSVFLDALHTLGRELFVILCTAGRIRTTDELEDMAGFLGLLHERIQIHLLGILNIRRVTFEEDAIQIVIILLP